MSWVISEVWGCPGSSVRCERCPGSSVRGGGVLGHQCGVEVSWVISEVWGCPASSVRCGDVLGSWESSGGQPCSVPKDWTMAVRGDSRVAGQRQS